MPRSYWQHPLRYLTKEEKVNYIFQQISYEKSYHQYLHQ